MLGRIVRLIRFVRRMGDYRLKPNGFMMKGK